MKKKRGFTLVELLAVIAILAILVIIALPNIMSLFNEAKKNSFTNEAREIVKVAEQQWMSDSLFNTSEKVYAKCSSQECPNQLKLSGRNNINYYIKLNKSGNVVQFYIEDGTYQYTYKGTGLKIEELDDVTELSSLSDNQILEIMCDGAKINGKDITNIQPSIPVSNVIYWALQDNDGDNKNETLIISDKEVSGNKSGSINGTDVFNNYTSVPWITASQSSSSNLSKDVITTRIEGNVAPVSTAFWFYGVGYFTDSLSLDLRNLNTSNVTNMDSMFSSTGGYSHNNVSINVSNWDTSKVTNMEGMFESAGGFATSSFVIIGLDNFDTSKVTTMYDMFAASGNVATTWNIGRLDNWDTSNVTNMRGMFEYAGEKATSWSIGDISNWNVSKVTNMNEMFDGAGEKATNINLGNIGGWDVSNVTEMRNMFSYFGYDATSWYIGDLSSWNTSKVTNMTFMFSSTGTNATSWSIGDLSNWNTSKVTNMKGMFQSAGKSATTFNLNLSNWNTSKVTNMQDMFNNAGYRATTWNVTIPKNNNNGLNNTTTKFYGSNSSTYVERSGSKLFTVAN